LTGAATVGISENCLNLGMVQSLSG